MLLKELKGNSALAEQNISKMAKSMGFGLRNIQASSKAGKGQTWVGATFVETANAQFKGKNKWFPEVGFRVYVAFTFKSNKFALRAWYFDKANKVNAIGAEHYEMINDTDPENTIKYAMGEMKEHLENNIRPLLPEAIKAYQEAN